jgi:peptide deformylase
MTRIPLALLTATPRTLALPEHGLRAVAAPVDFTALDRDVRARLVDGLVDVLFAGAPGAGLAAPMAGIGLRLVVMATDDRALALANPRIEADDGAPTVQEEGNLCLPGIRADVARPYEVTVAWEDPLSGRGHRETFTGWEARVLQHEIEILDGRMFLDHAEGRPLGGVAKPEDVAARAAAKLFGEPVPKPSLAEPLTVATFDPDLAALAGTVVRRPSVDVDLGATDPVLIRRLVEGLLHTQFAARGVGLAAPQAGLHLRIAAIDDRDGAPLLLLNPRVLDRDDHEIVDHEGCLTMPGLVGEVPRAAAITVLNHRPDGSEVTLELRGRAARIVQHEIDHLDGVLFTDHMQPGAPLVATAGAARADEARQALG